MDSTQHENARRSTAAAAPAAAEEAAGVSQGQASVVARTGAETSGAGANADESRANGRSEESSAGSRHEEPTASARLAQRRAELGMSLEDVAGQLKFAVRQIEALEAGEFDKLPGATFARGMVRTYARLLRVEPEPVLAQLAASALAPQVAPEDAVSMRTPIPFSDGTRRMNLVYAVLSLVVLMAVAYLVVEWYQVGEGASRHTAAPSADTTTLPPRPQGSSSNPGPRAASPAIVAGAEPAAGSNAPAAPAPQTTIVARAGAAAPAAGNEPRPGSVSTIAKRRIVFKFARESWVEVKAANGETLMSQLNRPGTERSIEGEPPFSLVIGNANNVQVTYNEKPVDLKPYVNDNVARLILD